jgi:hypothetical protein
MSKKRMRRKLVWIAMCIGTLLVLSRIAPHYSRITVTGPDGETYNMQSTGTGSHHMRLDLGDGSFAECGTE